MPKLYAYHPAGTTLKVTHDKTDRSTQIQISVPKSMEVVDRIGEPPVVVPPVVTPPDPTPTASPDGTMVPPAGKIVDAQLAVWTFANDVAPGGHSILKNGTQFGGGSGVLLLWKGGNVYTKNNVGAWYVAYANEWSYAIDPTGAAPTPTPTPTPTPVPEPAQTPAVKRTWAECVAYLESKNALIRSFDFADASQLGINQYGANFGWEPGGSGNPQIDPTVKAHPGGGSLKFTVPKFSGAKAAGEWYTNFSTDLKTRFGANTEFWLRWTERKNAAMCTTVLADPGGGVGIKTLIFGHQDNLPGGVPAGTGANPLIANSSDRMKLVVQTYNHVLPRFPIMYRYDQLMQNSRLETVIPGPQYPDYWLQNAVAHCLYSSDKSACFQWVPDRNDTYTMRVKIGAYDDKSYPSPVFANSEVQLYIQKPGESRVKVIDYKPSVNGYEPLRAVAGWEYGKVNLGPYITTKVATQDHPDMILWMTDLIFSKIDPGEAVDEMIPGGALPVTALGTLARSLSAGQWGELVVSNQDAILSDDGSSGSMCHFANQANWNPKDMTIDFVGADHHGAGSDMWFRHARYQASNNQYVEPQLRPIFAASMVGHGYGHNALDPVTGNKFFRRGGEIGSGIVKLFKKPYGASTFSEVADSPSRERSVADGMCWWSGSFTGAVGGSNGMLFQFSEGNAAGGAGSSDDGWIQGWSESAGWFFYADGAMPNITSTDGYHVVMAYSAIHNCAVYGGGNGTQKRLRRLNSDGTTTAMPDYPGSGRIGIQGGNLSVDPLDGNFVVLSDGEHWKLNPTGSGAWTQKSDPPAGVGDPLIPQGVISCSIPTYGCIAYITQSGATGGKMHLYKGGV